jgi:signal transduction histidine kinase
VVIAVASFTGATRVGGEVGRLERTERQRSGIAAELHDGPSRA